MVRRVPTEKLASFPGEWERDVLIVTSDAKRVASPVSMSPVSMRDTVNAGSARRRECRPSLRFVSPWMVTGQICAKISANSHVIQPSCWLGA